MDMVNEWSESTKCKCSRRPSLVWWWWLLKKMKRWSDHDILTTEQNLEKRIRVQHISSRLLLMNFCKLLNISTTFLFLQSCQGYSHSAHLFSHFHSIVHTLKAFKSIRNCVECWMLKGKKNEEKSRNKTQIQFNVEWREILKWLLQQPKKKSLANVHNLWDDRGKKKNYYFE